MARKSAQVALGGLSCALCLTLMTLSAVVPLSTYAAPALAGMMLIPAAVEMGLSTAFLAYVGVSALSLALVPDVEAALMFAAFFGYFPLLRMRLEQSQRPRLRMAVKFLAFNASMLLVYGVFLRLLGLEHLTRELAGGFGLLLLALGNVGLYWYDRALALMMVFYFVRLRPVLMRNR